jgi:hypothetical protein
VVHRAFSGNAHCSSRANYVIWLEFGSIVALFAPLPLGDGACHFCHSAILPIVQHYIRSRKLLAWQLPTRLIGNCIHNWYQIAAKLPVSMHPLCLPAFLPPLVRRTASYYVCIIACATAGMRHSVILDSTTVRLAHPRAYHIRTKYEAVWPAPQAYRRVGSTELSAQSGSSMPCVRAPMCTGPATSEYNLLVGNSMLKTLPEARGHLWRPPPSPIRLRLSAADCSPSKTICDLAVGVMIQIKS